jgi:hypothetical protein
MSRLINGSPCDYVGSTSACTPRQLLTYRVGQLGSVGPRAAVNVRYSAGEFVALGLYPVGMCSADFSAFIRKEYEDYGRAIRELNIKVE